MTAQDLEQRLQRIETLLETIGGRCLSAQELLEMEKRAYRRGYAKGRVHKRAGVLVADPAGHRLPNGALKAAA